MAFFLSVTLAVLAVFMVLAVGFVLRRLNWLTEDADHSLMTLVVRILIPCLIVTRVMGNPSLTEWQNIIAPPLAGIGFIAVGLIVTWLFTRPVAGWAGLRDATARQTFIYTTGIYNYYYIPLALVGPPLVPADMQKAVSGVLMVLFVGAELGMWTLGVLTLTGGMASGWWKKLLNPPALAVVGCVTLNMLGVGAYVQQPQVLTLMKPVHWLGECAIPMGLVLIGATIADHWPNIHWRGSVRVVGYSTFIRLLILPALLYAVLPWLPVSEELRLVLLIEATMPAAMLPIMVTRFYGGDLPTALRVVIGTSILGLAAIPAWLTVGQWWLSRW